MAGLHVLVIAVGNYPHLTGGDEDLVEEPMGLSQLSSPPVSAALFLKWLLGREKNPKAPTGYRNPQVPLASIEVVASPASIDMPEASGTSVDLADMNGIDKCFERWRLRCMENPENICVFYFCGHGMMKVNHYLLAADFGSVGNPWRHAFDITNTVSALKREIAAPIYFFIDACRQIPRELALKIGADALPLRTADLSKSVVSVSRLVLNAAGEGKKAFARQGEASRFTTALVQALSGYAGRKRPGCHEWEVTAEHIAHSVRGLLEVGHKAGEPIQEVAQDISGHSVFHIDDKQTKVMVALDLKPNAARAAHRIFLERSSGYAMEADGIKCPWKTEVPRGFYNIGAKPQNSNAIVVLYEDEDLEPPCYEHTVGI